MIFTPTFRIANFVIRKIVTSFGLNIAFYKLFGSLFHITGGLILTVGVIPTIKVLFAIMRYLPNVRNFNILSVLLGRYNPIVTTRILETIKPFWNECIKNPIIFKRLYYIYFFSVFFKSFRLLAYIVIKILFGGVLASLGIIWNETLSGIKIFKVIAEYILDTLNDMLKSILNIVRNVDKNPIQSKNFDSGWITFLTFTVLGFTGVVILMMIGDYYVPDTVRSMPYTGNILDSIYSFMNSVYEWYYGIKKSSNLPDTISRSTSGSSSDTLRGLNRTTSNIPTPPATPTPIIPENYENIINGNNF